MNGDRGREGNMVVERERERERERSWYGRIEEGNVVERECVRKGERDEDECQGREQGM